MTNTIQALSREVHGSKRWKRSANLHFAAKSNAVGLLADELPRAAMVLPLAFMKRGESFVPTAVLGLAPNENLLLDKDDKWIGRYTPATLRSYPFLLARPAGEEDPAKRVLCVQSQNDVIVDGDEGSLIFDEKGEPSPEIKKMLEFLLQMEQSNAKTERAVAALAAAGVIVPWKLALQAGDKKQTLEGLFHVDEKALNELADEAYLKLRKAGAVALAHLMLLSEQNLPSLVELARHRRRAAAKAAETATQH